MSIVIGIIAFSIIVLIHELGHFVAARKCGVLVEEFAIGMGPKLFSTKRGDTLYSIRMFPIGGFCNMLGDDNESSDVRSLNNKKLWQRAIIFSAGAVLNFALAFIVFILITSVTGIGLPVVQSVVDGSPAAEAGLMTGDRIVKANGTRINIYEDLFFELNENGAKPIEISIKRSGQIFTKTITPYKSPDNERYMIGFAMVIKAPMFGDNPNGLQRVNLLECIVSGFYQILYNIKVTILGIVRLITFNLSLGDVSGPIGIFTMLDEVYKENIKTSVWSTIINISNFIALLSANLGVFNLLPLPALDGGRLVFLFLEGIRKKPVNQEKEGLIHLVGLVLLMVLAVFIAYNDIMKII